MTEIETVRTQAVLDRVASEVFRAARPATRDVLERMAADARRRVPDWPLSRAFRSTGWKPNRGRLRYDAPKIRRSIRVIYPRGFSGQVLRLGTLTMSDPAGTLLDMAARPREPRTVGFVNALYAYGRPSRIMWPAATGLFGRLESDLQRAAIEVGDRLSRELAP